MPPPDELIELPVDDVEEPVEDQEIDEQPEPQPAPEDDLPDDLLSDEQRTERAERRQQADEAERRRKAEENEQFVAGLRDVFTQIRQQPQQPQQPVPQQQQQRQAPPQLTPEQREQINAKILEQPDGILRAIEWAQNQGYQRAVQEIRGDAAPLLQSQGEAIADRYVASRIRDESLGKSIAPYFDKVVGEWDLSSLATMPREERMRTLDNLWDVAAGRMVREKGKVRPAASPGVGRGATSGGPPARRVKYTMTDAEKKSIYDSLPNTEEGRKRAERQIREIEYGVTSDPYVARQVKDSQMMRDAVRFGG